MPFSSPFSANFSFLKKHFPSAAILTLLWRFFSRVEKGGKSLTLGTVSLIFFSFRSPDTEWCYCTLLRKNCGFKSFEIHNFAFIETTRGVRAVQGGRLTWKSRHYTASERRNISCRGFHPPPTTTLHHNHHHRVLGKLEREWLLRGSWSNWRSKAQRAFSGLFALGLMGEGKIRTKKSLWEKFQLFACSHCCHYGKLLFGTGREKRGQCTSQRKNLHFEEFSEWNWLKWF